jgi:hypothetical protein
MLDGVFLRAWELLEARSGSQRQQRDALVTG